MTASTALQYRPPRLLLGMALLFCGWMVDHPLLYLVAAVAVESPRWVGRRFEISNRTFARAWQLGWVSGGLVFFGFWLNDVSHERISQFSGLLPIFLVPLLTVELYSKEGSTPLTTFSYFARRKRRTDLEAGRPVEDNRVCVGYPFLTIVLVAASMNHDHSYYFYGIAILVVIALWSQTRRGMRRWKALAIFLIMVSGLAAFGAKTVYDLKGMLQSGDQLALMFGRQLSPKFHQTGVGRIHHLKQSKRVIWYLEIEEGLQPSLLRETTYASYRRGMWRNPGEMTFTNLTSLPNAEWSWGFPMGEAGEIIPTKEVSSSRLRLRGEIDRGSVLALPSHATRLDNLVTYEVSTNSFNCVRLDEPSQTVIDFTVEHGSHRGVEAGPGEWDMEIPEGEQVGIAKFVDDHQLRGLSQKELITELKLIFLKDFTYSLNIRQEHVGGGAAGKDSGLSYFLNEGKVGYCEYFAGATALVLRECGYPSRYAVGFAVAEQDGEGRFLLRGIHAHAWTRAWADGMWIDVDLTPPDWVTEDNQQTWIQGLVDAFYDIRQQVTLWRLEGKNSTLVNGVLMGLIGLMVLVVGLRIWWLHRNGRLRSSSANGFRRGRAVAELRKIEALLVKQIGARSIGEPVGGWLRRLGTLRPELHAEAERCAELYQSLRFDPESTGGSQQLLEAVADLRQKLKAQPSV